MSRLAVLLHCLLSLCVRATTADADPILTTVTVPTTSESLTTLTSAGLSTSIVPGAVTTFVTTIRGTPIPITSTLAAQTSVTPFTSIEVSTITVNTNTVVVSTVGFSITTSSDDPATKTAVSASTTASASSVTDAPNLSTSALADSSSIIDTHLSLNQSTSKSSATLSSRTAATSSAVASAVPHSSQSKGGLTSAQRAGIGAGIALGVVLTLVLIAIIILWRHGLLSRKAHAEDVFDENEDFVHRPYSMLFSQKKQIEVQHEKPEAATHHVAYGPDARLSNPIDMPGTTRHAHASEEPVYLGVPTHMSGQKRWSKGPQGEA